MSLGLRVVAAPTEPQHRCLVRIDPQILAEAALGPGALVEVRSAAGRTVLARIAEVAPSDRGRGTIAVDRFIRQAIKVRLGDVVSIGPVQARPIERVVVAPAIDITLIHGLIDHLQKRFASSAVPVCVGSILYATFPESGGGTTYRVIEVEGGPGAVGESTRVEIAPSGAQGDDLPPDVTFEDIGGLDRQIRLVRELIELPLLYPHVYRTLGINPPRGIIFYGPPGVGKTHLARAIANEVDARFYYINGPDIVGTMHGETEGNLRRMFSEAAHHAPSLIFIDELDAVAPKRSETGSQSDTRMVTQLLSLLDGLGRVDGVTVIGTTNRIDSLEAAMRRPGRFDREVLIGPPDASGRLQILQIHSRDMPLTIEALGHLEGVAERAHGMVGADLMELCREAGLNALRRALVTKTDGWKHLEFDLAELVVEPVDFDAALGRVRPSALREAIVTVPDTRWEDVGGLDAVKRRLREVVEEPLLHPESFSAMKLRPPTGILLYGPPGTGKTLLAKAVACQTQANFISIKGPEIFSKWLGESEEGVRHIFRVARQVAPAVVFFDQLDAIATSRGADDSTKTTERVVNQLLAEMDGIEPLNRIIVIGATNRVDLLDPAVLRPGRFGVHIQVPLPDDAGRAEILRTHLAHAPLAGDVDAIIERLAPELRGFSGAEIEALCEEAKLVALRGVGFRMTATLSIEHLLAGLGTIQTGRKLYGAEQRPGR